MTEPLRTTLIVPCYNEASRLDTEQFRLFLSSHESIRLLFVDDGSDDATRDVLDRLCSGYEDRTTVLALAKNKGKAEAVRAGVLHALENFRPQIVGYWDADLATPLDTLPRFLLILEQRPEVEMVFGSRVKLLGHQIERVPLRHYLSRVFVTMVALVLKIPIYDSQCGAKVFRVGKDCRQVFSEAFLSKWIFDVEILARYLVAYGYDPSHLQQVIYEYPLEKWIDVASSKVRLPDFVLAFSDILRIKYRYL